MSVTSTCTGCTSDSLKGFLGQSKGMWWKRRDGTKTVHWLWLESLTDMTHCLATPAQPASAATLLMEQVRLRGEKPQPAKSGLDGIHALHMDSRPPSLPEVSPSFFSGSTLLLQQKSLPSLQEVSSFTNRSLFILLYPSLCLCYLKQPLCKY